jgi:disulfide bond formation protein DsbB
MTQQNNLKVSAGINIMELACIFFILASAYYLQFFHHDIPCPLCLLQRIGFLFIAFGLILNISFGAKPLHYGLSMLGSLFTMIISTRQIFLHIAPGTGSYGPPLFGLHLYTWGFIAASGLMFINIILVVFYESMAKHHIKHPTIVKSVGHLVFLLLFCIATTNIVTTFMECGLKECPSDPTKYKYVKKKIVKPASNHQLHSMFTLG